MVINRREVALIRVRDGELEPERSAANSPVLSGIAQYVQACRQGSRDRAGPVTSPFSASRRRASKPGTGGGRTNGDAQAIAHWAGLRQGSRDRPAVTSPLSSSRDSALEPGRDGRRRLAALLQAMAHEFRCC